MKKFGVDRVECGINADIPLADAAQYLGELNALIPPLKADIAQYAAHQKLVSTLELLFSTYMDTLTLMVSNFNLRLDSEWSTSLKSPA